MKRPSFDRRAIVRRKGGPDPRRWKRRAPVVGGLVLIVIVVAIGWWGLQTKQLTIKRVGVSSAVEVRPDVVPDAKLQSYIRAWRGSWLWTDTAAIERSIERKFPELASVSAKTSFPDRLDVRYLPRVALCQLLTPTGTYLMDRQGVIFAPLKSNVSYLPVLRADTRPTIGRQVSARGVVLGLTVITELRGQHRSVKDATLRDGELDISLDGPPRIRISESRDATQARNELSALLTRFTRENKYPAELDLRFDRPVLR